MVLTGGAIRSRSIINGKIVLMGLFEDDRTSETEIGPITEAEGFKIGNEVRSRGADIGTIRRIFKVGNKHRALVYWPTKPHTGEKLPNGQQEVYSPDCEQHVDLAKLTKVIPALSGTGTTQNLVWHGYCECKWDETRSTVIEIHPACRLHTERRQQPALCCSICGGPIPCNSNDPQGPL
jgi:hypothetical protein